MEQLVPYKGITIYSNNRHVRRATMLYKLQKTRCYNKNNIKYKYYGAKGLTVDYSLREFIAWYLLNIKSCGVRNPTVGRIDHNYGYSFNNIRLESLSDNSKERILRKGNPSKDKTWVISCFKNGIHIGDCFGTRAASTFAGRPKSTIYSLMTTGKEDYLGFSFKRVI